MLKSFRLQGDILSLSNAFQNNHTHLNLRKKYYICQQFNSSNDAAALFFFHPTSRPCHIVYMDAVPLYRKEFKVHCTRNRRKLSRTVKHSDQSTHWAPGSHKVLFLYFIKLPLIATFKIPEISSR